MAGFRRALEALDDCVTKKPAANSAFDSLRAEAGALEPELTPERLRRTPESIDTALNLIYRIEQQTVDTCGQGSAFDRALLPAVRLFFVPVLVSLVTGALLAWVFPDVRGSGVPQTEAAYHLRGGVIPARVPLGKFVTGVLCIGSGHSMGREGPSVQIGAGLASVIGRWVPLSPARVKDLVPVGAAGALAAAFNTPWPPYYLRSRKSSAT
jgi:H+/Cl- antiporter ClcA